MPLTKEQEAALTGLFATDGALKDADPEDVAESLQKKVPSVHTIVFNEGKAKGEGVANKAIKTNTKEIERLTGEVTRLEGELETAKAAPENKNPDVEKIRNEAKDQIAAAKQKVKDLEKQHATDLENRDRERAADRFIEILAEKNEAGIVRPSVRRSLRHDPELMERLKVKDGELVVLQKGKNGKVSEIPISATDDSADGPLKALAQEYRERFKKEEPDALIVHVDDGAGIEGGNGAGQDSGYDPVKAGNEMAKQQIGERDRTKGLAFR
jgi:hypothetical protein